MNMTGAGLACRTENSHHMALIQTLNGLRVIGGSLDGGVSCGNEVQRTGGGKSNGPVLIKKPRFRFYLSAEPVHRSEHRLPLPACFPPE